MLTRASVVRPRSQASCLLRLKMRNRLYARVGFLSMLALCAVGWGVYRSYTNREVLSATSPARHLLQASDSGNYPPNTFTDEQLKNGAVVLHFLGTLYMFLGLAIVCDEFFVPALEEITARLGISEDVAGATFMAAGGSAPELFTNFIGTFVGEGSNVGLGTIVGSAVFNVLFVIGMCAIFSRDVLTLTWFPLFRDSVFYTIFLSLLVVFFNGGEVEWWESLILLGGYGAYVWFMKYNHRIEKWAVLRYGNYKTRRNKQTGKVEEVLDTTAEQRYRLSEAEMHKMRRISFHVGAMALMLKEVDPLGRGPSPDEEGRFKRAAMIVAAQNAAQKNESTDNLGKLSDVATMAKGIQNGANHEDRRATTERDDNSGSSDFEDRGKSSDPLNEDVEMTSSSVIAKEEDNNSVDDPMDDGEGGGLSLEWPEGWRARLYYIILMPISYTLYYTLPDVSQPRWKSWFPVTFIGSIIWIGVYSYFMVWWATIVGETAGIPIEVMGLTLLAAGTSVPDLLTSVLVARKGYGDMAVSSSIGSNIFDVCIGLPLPWIIDSLVQDRPIAVTEDSLFNVGLLLAMLVLVIGTIAVNKWRMTRVLGGAMFVLYGVFLTLALLVEFGRIHV